MFKPIFQVSDLPVELIAHETLQLDFKVTVEDADRLEMALDVAAFANTLGGTILIGAAEKPGHQRLGRYLPLEERTAADLGRAYDEAIRDRCSPKPLAEI